MPKAASQSTGGETPEVQPADPADAARAKELALQRKVVAAVHARTHEGNEPIPIVQPGPENAEPEA